jgi:hypothetical protein
MVPNVTATKALPALLGMATHKHVNVRIKISHLIAKTVTGVMVGIHCVGKKNP